MHIVHARASSLCVSTLWVHQAITSSLFQSSTILMMNLFIKYYVQFFTIPSYSQRDRCQLLIQCVSDCRSRDPEFDPGLVAYLEIDHEIISIVILLPSADCWGLYRGLGTKYPILLEVNRQVSILQIRKYHNYKRQRNPWLREEEPLNNHETPGRQLKQSNQLSLFPIRMIAKLEWT